MCRKLVSDDICKYPNINCTLTEAILNLGPIGKKIIKRNIKDNTRRNKIIDEKKDFLFNFFHSKRPIKCNPWKCSNRTRGEFSSLPIDKVYSFTNNVNYTTKLKKNPKPFRIPKIYGDYFDKKVY